MSAGNTNWQYLFTVFAGTVHCDDHRICYYLLAVMPGVYHNLLVMPVAYKVVSCDMSGQYMMPMLAMINSILHSPIVMTVTLQVVNYN